jgi:hypothetical protein
LFDWLYKILLGALQLRSSHLADFEELEFILREW